MSVLEAIVGASEQELDEIEQIIRQAATQAQSDPTRFEQLVNPKLKSHGVEFTQTHPTLVNSGAPAAYDDDTVLVRTPTAYFNLPGIMVAISHELVHRGQVEAADKAGGKEAILNQSQRMVGPGGKVDWKAYQKDPHETTAYARSAVDVLKGNGMNREQVLAALRKGQTPVSRPADRNRFLKKAYAYATHERAREVVDNLLEDESVDTEPFLEDK